MRDSQHIFDTESPAIIIPKVSQAFYQPSVSRTRPQVPNSNWIQDNPGISLSKAPGPMLPPPKPTWKGQKIITESLNALTDSWDGCVKGPRGRESEIGIVMYRTETEDGHGYLFVSPSTHAFLRVTRKF